MVVTQKFFRADWNAGGKGLAHQYETKAVQNVLVVVDHATRLMWQRGGRRPLDVFCVPETCRPGRQTLTSARDGVSRQY